MKRIHADPSRGNATHGTGQSRKDPLNARKRARSTWTPMAWALALAAAAALAVLISRLAAAEVASLAAFTDFAGRDNVFFGTLFAQLAIATTLLARGARAPIRRRRQLVAIALGLLAIASLLFGARGVIFTTLMQIAWVCSFPRKDRF